MITNNIQSPIFFKFEYKYYSVIQKIQILNMNTIWSPKNFKYRMQIMFDV